MNIFFKLFLLFLLFPKTFVTASSLSKEIEGTFTIKSITFLSGVKQNIAFVLDNWENFNSFSVIPPDFGNELDFEPDREVLKEVDRQKELWKTLLDQSNLSEDKLLFYFNQIQALFNIDVFDVKL